MIFVLGFFCGILISVLIFVIEIYLKPRGLGVPQVKRLIEQKTGLRGAVIFPVSEAARSVEEKIKENNKKGEDTNLDDILL